MKLLGRLGLLFAVACIALPANGAMNLALTQNPDPAPGLESFTISGVSTAGEIIDSFVGINAHGPIHNVLPPFGQPSVTSDHWAADSANGASLAAWSIFDTYILFDPSSVSRPAFGGNFVETNDGTDPAGLNLSHVGQPATEGLGSFGHELPNGFLVFPPDLSGTNVPFLQIVQPTGSQTLLDVKLGDTLGNNQQITGFVVSNIPEPTTLALAGLGLLSVSGIRRRG